MLTFCFVPVEKIKETYWLFPQQVWLSILHLCSLSDTRFALVAALANNFFFATILNLSLYKLCPDSPACLFKVTTFTLSPKAILKYGRQVLRAVVLLFSPSHTLKLCFSFLLYISVFSSSGYSLFYDLVSPCVWESTIYCFVYYWSGSFCTGHP